MTGRNQCLLQADPVAGAAWENTDKEITMAELETTKLLKAESFRALGSKVAYSFNDIEKRCEDYILKVRDQTRQMILDAQQEAEQLKQTAYQEARQQGLDSAQQELEALVQARAEELASQMVQEKLGTVYPAMQQAVEGLHQERVNWRQVWDASAVEICLGIAEKLIRHEINAKPESVRPMMSEALKLASGAQQIRFRLNPIDVEHLGQNTKNFISNLTGCQDCEIIEDETISPGGCLIETQHGTIDATLETQLERISEELIIQNQD
ncbi:flagellar assembly protein H [Gimesia panareensis]|uniref:Flagellar assembly protein FliH n=2 Tax=Gimesia panareensis TaxID=2527978 RepID=A0A517Q745_9PLAN|nr:flagellar assembly protein H [Gimesia panareensis]